MSGKDDLILLFYCYSSPLILLIFIFPSCGLSFDGTTRLLTFCQVFSLLKPLAFCPHQLLQLSLQVIKTKQAA